jgi:adenine/guanine/hypoxanthine permease
MKGNRSIIPLVEKRDLDGFFGLGLDNLIQFILISTLCHTVLGMPLVFIATRVFPGAALSIIFGNVFYAWQARRLARRTGRTDVTALPYGINTVSLLAFVFFVMLPVYQESGNPELAWKVGVLACFLSGAIELLGAFVAEKVRRLTPRAALLSALAGIAMTFISMDFLFKIYQRPLIAMIPMVIILIQYFSRIRYPFGLPGGLVAIVLGSLLYWMFPPAGVSAGLMAFSESLSLSPPRLAVSSLWDVVHSEHLLRHLSIIVPMGLLNVVGSLQNIESAEAGGDTYSTTSSLSVNGLCSILASFFGSCFPTTIYIGHPGWKAMGARSGYSLLNAVFVGLLCFSGTVLWVIQVIPLESGVGILLWIGIVICAQAFQTTPHEHAPAIAFGIFPCLAAWGKMQYEEGLRAAGSGFYQVLGGAGSGGFPYQGLLSLDQGFLSTAMIFASIAVYMIEKNFRKASWWSLVGALFAFFGLIHGYTVTPAGVLPHIGWGAAKGYALNYFLFFLLLQGIHHWGKSRQL